MVRKLAGAAKIRHVFWQSSRLTCRLLVQVGELYLESDDLQLKPANEWEEQAFATLAGLKV